MLGKGTRIFLHDLWVDQVKTSSSGIARGLQSTMFCKHLNTPFPLGAILGLGEGAKQRHLLLLWVFSVLHPLPGIIQQGRGHLSSTLKCLQNLMLCALSG